MAEWFSIEVLHGSASARSWVEAFGDSLIGGAIAHGAIDWHWHHHNWGSVLELAWLDEADFENFRILPFVEAAFDAVPDRVNGLLIHRGRGGSAGTRLPRKPRPFIGSGSIGLPLPEQFVEELYLDPQPRVLLAL